MIPLPEGHAPRAWQVEAWAALRRGLTLWDAVLVSAATGTGKGTLLAGLCAAWSARGRVLFLVHREELVRDVAARVARLCVEAQALCGGQTKAERQQALAGRVICATVQTLRAPVVQALLAHGPVTWVLTDEAHHATAPSYLRLYRLLAEQDVSMRHVGVTATPYRFIAGGGLTGLGSVFKEHVYDYPLDMAVADGVLVPLRGLALHTGVDLRGVDLADDNAVEQALDQSDRNRLILEGWKQHGQGRLTVGFAAGVEHAKHLAQLFAGAGVPSSAVWGSDPERAEKLAALRRGEIRVLWNCALLTEGVDVPEVSCVLLARPTDSPGLYAQMVGRGTRTAPGKEDCLVLDCADMTERHDLMRVGMLQAGEEEQAKGRVPLKPGDRVEHKHDTTRADGNVVEVLDNGFVTVLWAGREVPELCPAASVRRVRPQLDGVEVQVARCDVGTTVALEVALLGGRPEGWYHYRSSGGTDRYTLRGSWSNASLQLVREAPGVWSAWEVSAAQPRDKERVICLHPGGGLSEALAAALDIWRPWRPVPWTTAAAEGLITPRQAGALKRWGMRRTTAGMSRAEACALMQTKITMSKVDAERKLRRQGKRGAA